MFTPFAFFQNAVVVAAAPASFAGYYVGGGFNTYATNTNPYFRMLNSTGSISSSFNQGTGFNSSISAVDIQSDGKIIVGGAFSAYSGSTRNSIARLNTNGTLDTTLVVGTGFNSIVYSVAVQSDQKIVAGGVFTTYSGSTKNRINRLNANGTSDTGSTWNIGVGFGGAVHSVAVQFFDQKIIAGGSYTTYSGSTKNNIIRLNTDGTADTGSTWNQGTGCNSTVNIVLAQSDQKILVGGAFSTYSGSTATRIARINTDGTLDTTLVSGTGFGNVVYGMAIQSDQKMIVGGAFTTYSGSTRNYIVRVNTDGTIDNTFNIGVGFDNAVYNVAVQSDQKILVQGAFSNYSGSVALGIVRLNTDGTRDTTFNLSQSINQASFPGNPTIQLSNGSIILGGSYSGNRIGYQTFFNTSGGRTAQSIIDSYGFNQVVYTSVSQSDGALLIGGNFTYYSGSIKNFIVKLNTNGTVITGSTWNQGTGFGSTVYSLTTQSDGKIIAGGGFTTYSGSTRNRIARINTNGTSDTTLVIGTGFNNTVNTVAVQSDQKILVGGLFTLYSGSTKNYIVRLNTDGTADTGSTWNQGAGIGGTTINSIVIQSDQKIIAGGNISTYSGSSANGIVRINTNGTIDTSPTWNSGTGFNGPVNSLALQSDGKILAGGTFTAYSGSTINRIARLNTNGTLDTTFNPGTAGANGVVNIISVDSTNQIMIGGGFTTYSGSTVNGIVRLNTNGTIDTNFTPTGSGFNGSPLTILPF